MAFLPQCSHQLLKSILRKSFCTIPPGLQRAIFQLQNRMYKTPYGKKSARCQTYVKKSVSGGDQTRQRNEPSSPWGILKWDLILLHKWSKLKKRHQLKKTCGNIFKSVLGNRNQKTLSDWSGCDCLVTVCKHAKRLLGCQKLDVS